MDAETPSRARGRATTVRLNARALEAVDRYIADRDSPVMRAVAIEAIVTEWLAQHGYLVNETEDA